jgi:hypothetical protein
MSFFLRTTTFPPLNQITAVPQITIIDQTGPAVVLGTSPGAACMAGEFVSGPVGLPTETDTANAISALYTPGDGSIYPYLSQDGSSPAIQNGSGVAYNGNGMLQLFSQTFQRLILVRVDHEAVTTDGGTTKGQLTLTITVAAADQAAGVTNKNIVIPAGARFGSANTFAGSTRVFAASGTAAGSFVIPAGTTVTSNAVTVNVNCFPIVVIEPVVATAIAAIAFVLDPVLPNVDPATTITAVNNATTLWPNGVGTTLALRVASMYPAALNATAPNATPMTDIQIIWAARRVQSIRQALATNAVNSSAVARGRIALVSAEPATAVTQAAALTAITAAEGLAVSDGYVQPADRVIICFPQSQVTVPALGSNANVAVSINSDSWMASTLANFAEEVNPGASNPYMQGITAMEPAFAAYPLAKADYINLIAAGVCALYFDRTQGWQWIQGVTAANKASFPTRTPIKRRRMADLIQDSLDEIASPFEKEPATQDRVDSMLGEVQSFLEDLKSINQPSLARIVDYLIDETSYNNDALNSQGVFIYGIKVRTIPSLDFPVFFTQIGETVVINNPVSAAPGGP